MTELPSSNLLNQWILENPWPMGITLLVAGAALAWTGLRGGMRERQRWAIVPCVLGASVIGLGLLIKTAGERAAEVTRAFVEAVVAEDVIAADRLLAPQPALALGSPMNPGYDAAFLRERLDFVADRYDIETNTITRLDGSTQSGSVGVVRLSCLTRESGLPYPMASQWQIRVERQDDGAWKIAHITFVSLNDQPPSSSHLR